MKKSAIFILWVFLLMSFSFVSAEFGLEGELAHTHPELEPVYNCTIIPPGQTGEIDISGFYGAEERGWTTFNLSGAYGQYSNYRPGGILYVRNMVEYESNEVFNSQIAHQKNDEEIVVSNRSIHPIFRSNGCESIKSFKILKCADTVAEMENADTSPREGAFEIKECGEKEMCLTTKVDPTSTGGCMEMEQVCPAKISWESDGKIITPEHYPNIFIKVYDSENNAVNAIINYTIYINYGNSELVDDGLVRIPKEGLEVIVGEDLKELVETNKNTGSYKIIYRGQSPDCETEKVIEFTIKDSMNVFDRIAEFFRLVF